MTHDTEVLVVGAGPAGASAARACAGAGMHVTMVDRARFPRHKICGDALIPDALAVLRRVGLDAAVTPHARPVRELRIFPPDGPAVRLGGEFQCVPRFTFDQLLVRAAVDAGASLMTGVRVRVPIEDGAVVRGAVLTSGDGEEVRVRARTTVLATGADPAILHAFGVGRQVRSNAVALRTYCKVDPELAREIDYLAIAFQSDICPGYGWIFPGPDDTFNVGVGWFSRTPGRAGISLHALLDLFLRSFPLARRMSAERALAAPRGAQIRTSHQGARFARPGLLVAGEAAGTTYAATGEGIGKAMETGLLAAEVITDARDGSQDTIAIRYARELRARFVRRFEAYDAAQRWSSRPWVLNLLARRANQGTFVRQQLEALVAETSDPGELFSAAGLLKALIF